MSNPWGGEDLGGVGGVSFFLFFGSLGVFASFDGKLSNNLEKTKQKQQNQCFFLFSRGFLLLLVENLEDTITCCETLIVRQSFVLNISSTSCYISTLAHLDHHCLNSSGSELYLPVFLHI